MDVKNAFLNGQIEEEVYIEKPKGFETFDRESHVPTQESVVLSLRLFPGSRREYG